MKARLVLTACLLAGSIAPTLSPLCLGAQHAIVMASAKQERKTPDGEWCQRPEANMPKEAHACDCHKQDCTDGDPEHVPAHTDPMCLNFCTVSQCSCPGMDCQ